MRILTVLTYYRPHISGLTIYAERLAKALVRRGHQVTVLTSHYQKDLAYEEISEGVRIVRAPVMFRLSKGVIMPTFGSLANRLVLQNDVILLHVPQFDAAGLALRGRLLKKPTVVVYHCDLHMPPGLLSRSANAAVALMNYLSAHFSHRIVATSRDYADNSPFLKNYLGKLQVIPPPVELPDVSEVEVQEFKKEFNPEERWPVIGMAARFATEKGVEVLLGALPELLKVFPRALVLFVGPYKNIVGEEAYYKHLFPLIEKYQASGNWKFTGVLEFKQITMFYKNLDVLVIPSLNSTEAFGLVQIEAFLNGVPSVVSDLPGVRQPVKIHQMGKVVPIGDSQALAAALLEVLAKRDQYNPDREAIAKMYRPDTIAAEFEKLFLEMQQL
jgi:glycosyltransferase involved in cell wall biosynthesis